MSPTDGLAQITYKCRNCGKYFAPQGIANHERRCLPVYTPRADMIQSDASVDSISSPSSEHEPSARFEFPKMLYKMLEDCTFDEEYCKIISWQTHGLAFKVHNRDELEKILPQWFREKYESWRCLLEQWGFLKLTRGKDRGCWYHKKFYHRSNSIHSQKKYEHVEKDDFIESMPEYLSFRDEPDLEKESTLDNRISPKKRKQMVNLLLQEKEAKSKKVAASTAKSIFGSTKEKEKSHTSRYRLSTLKECRYCHELFAPQGFSKHEDACRKARKRSSINESDSGDEYDDESERNALSESDDDDDDEEEEEENGDMVKCRYCGNYYNKYGVRAHERSCMLIDHEQTLSEDSESDESENANRVPCRFCGAFFTKVGVQLHERACKEAKTTNNDRGSGNKNNQGGSVLSDDSSVDSVDSIESGCRICGFDDDHANLLLCEGCDKEVHTYCLNPPLEKVPAGDWFCDTCKLRMGKAEEELCELLKKVPPEIKESFGEICFAKSAENAHWWPALIFDPRSFLHNREVVDLARRNLGKRYLVFFFENQDAFAAIPKTWIMPWDKGVEKEYDKGRSVRNASKSRKEQFQRAMDLANEAFEGGSSGDSESGEMEFNLQIDSDMEDHSLASRIPRVIGGNSTIFDLCPDFDWKSIREVVRKEVDAASPSEYPETVAKENLQSISQKSGKSQVQVSLGGKSMYIGLFSDQRKASFAVTLFRQKMKAAMDEFDRDDTTLGPHSEFGDKAGQKKATTGSPQDDAKSSPKPVPFGTFTDRKPIRSRSRSKAKSNEKTQTNTKNDTASQQKPPQQPLPKKKGKKLDSQQDKTDLPEKTPLPPLSDHERNELLLNTSLCHYYLLPLSQL